MQFVVREDTASRATGEQALRHGIADELFHRIAHRACAKFRMKALAHEERQGCLVEFDPVAARGEEFDIFTRPDRVATEGSRHVA